MNSASSMNAILLSKFGGSEVMVFGEAERPQPSEGQLLIKVEATSVNRADIIQRQGNYSPPKGDSEILGLEAAGTVQLLGDKVTAWKVGDRVMALTCGGGYAEYALTYADHAIPIPKHMEFEHAACICETYLTAYLNLFRIARLEGEQTVLLHGGGGGINTAAIQLCQQLVPDVTIIVTASTQKIERVKQLGAHHVIDYRCQSFADRVKEITANRGANVILDHIGASYLEANMKSLAVGGTLMLIGLMGGSTAELNLARTMVKRQRIIGSVLRSRPRAEKTSIIADFRKSVLPHLASGAISPLISEIYPLSQAANAHRTMEASTHFGKLVLQS